MSALHPQVHNARYLLLTLLVFVIACAPSVMKRSIWTDEAWSMLVLSGQLFVQYPETVTTPRALQSRLHQQASTRQTLRTLIEDDVHPPVYFLLAKLWTSVFGQSLVSLRWMSVGVGLAAIVVFFHFLNLYSPILARFATPLFAFSTGVLHFSTEVRLYVVSLLGLVTTLFLMACIDTRGRRRHAVPVSLPIMLILFSASTVLTNYLAAFPVAACYLWLFAQRPSRRLALLCAVCSFALVALWLPMLFRHGQAAGIATGGLSGLAQELGAFYYAPEDKTHDRGLGGFVAFAYVLVRATLGSFFVPSHIAYPGLLDWAGRLLLLALMAAGVGPAVARGEPAVAKSFAVLVALLSVAPAAGMVILYLAGLKQIVELRYLMLAAPGVAALAGIGLLRLYRYRTSLCAPLLAAALALLLSVANWGYATSYYQGKTHYREFADRLREQPLADSLVIAGTGPLPGNTTALFYELPADTPVLVLREDSDLHTVMTIAAQYRHVWLVRVREKTRHVEDQLAQSLQRERDRGTGIHQIEHYEQGVPGSGAARLWSALRVPGP